MSQHDEIASTTSRIATPDPYESRAFPTGSDLSTFVAELRLIKQDLRRNRDLKDPAYGLFVRTTCLKFRNGPPIVSPTRVDRYFKNIKAFQVFGVGAKKIEGAEAPPRPFLDYKGKPLVDASGRPEPWFPGERWTAEIGCQSAERLRLVAGVLARLGLLCHKYLAPEPWYLLADRDAEHEIYRRITHECAGGLDPLMAHCWRPVWDEHGDGGALDGPDPRPEMMALDDLEGIASRLVSSWQSRAEGDAIQKPPATTAAPPATGAEPILKGERDLNNLAAAYIAMRDAHPQESQAATVDRLLASGASPWKRRQMMENIALLRKTKRIPPAPPRQAKTTTNMMHVFDPKRGEKEF